MHKYRVHFISAKLYVISITYSLFGSGADGKDAAILSLLGPNAVKSIFTPLFFDMVPEFES
jgi:hypothetical protein